MYKEIIEELCNELNIKYTYLSKKWIIRLEKNNIIKYLVGNKFDLNGHAIGILMDDKYAFYDTLKSLNIPVCLHHIFYRKNDSSTHAIGCNTYESIYEYFYKYNENIVVKINKGLMGKDVYHIKDKEELTKILDKIFIENKSISICPYYDIKNEYRVIILNNEIKLLFKKEKPIVIGNGVNTIKELLIEFNKNYFENIELPDTVLKQDEIYEYDWHFNLSRGSKASTKIDKELLEKISNLALEVTKKVGIKFASIDIIETKDKELLVLEANSGVTINKATNFIENGREIAKSIYKEALIELMKD